MHYFHIIFSEGFNLISAQLKITFWILWKLKMIFWQWKSDKNIIMQPNLHLYSNKSRIKCLVQYNCKMYYIKISLTYYFIFLSFSSLIIFSLWRRKRWYIKSIRKHEKLTYFVKVFLPIQKSLLLYKNPFNEWITVNSLLNHS